MSAEVDALVTQVATTVGVEDQATAFINGVAPILADATADKAKAVTATSDLKTHTDSLAAALAAVPA